MVFIQLLLIFPALLVAFYGWGSLLNRAFFPSHWYKLPLVTNIALGMGMVGYVTFFFGHLGLIHIITGWIILTIGVYLSARQILMNNEYETSKKILNQVKFNIEFIDKTVKSLSQYLLLNYDISSIINSSDTRFDINELYSKLNHATNPVMLSNEYIHSICIYNSNLHHLLHSIRM